MCEKHLCSCFCVAVLRPNTSTCICEMFVNLLLVFIALRLFTTGFVTFCCRYVRNRK